MSGSTSCDALERSWELLELDSERARLVDDLTAAEEHVTRDDFAFAGAAGDEDGDDCDECGDGDVDDEREDEECDEHGDGERDDDGECDDVYEEVGEDDDASVFSRFTTI